MALRFPAVETLGTLASLVGGGAVVRIVSALSTRQTTRNAEERDIRNELWARIGTLEERADAQATHLEECRKDRNELRIRLATIEAGRYLQNPDPTE
jgi:hypothetical protein